MQIFSLSLGRLEQRDARSRKRSVTFSRNCWDLRWLEELDEITRNHGFPSPSVRLFFAKKGAVAVASKNRYRNFYLSPRSLSFSFSPTLHSFLPDFSRSYLSFILSFVHTLFLSIACTFFFTFFFFFFFSFFFFPFYFPPPPFFSLSALPCRCKVRFQFSKWDGCSPGTSTTMTMGRQSQTANAANIFMFSRQSSPPAL